MQGGISYIRVKFRSDKFGQGSQNEKGCNPDKFNNYNCQKEQKKLLFPLIIRRPDIVAIKFGPAGNT
jgi:hypothetical protein